MNKTVNDIINELNKIPNKNTPIKDVYYGSIVELVEVFESACEGDDKYKYMWHGITLGLDAIECLNYNNVDGATAKAKRFQKRFEKAEKKRCSTTGREKNNL